MNLDVHEQCLAEIRERIAGLKLDVPADTIVVRRHYQQRTGDKQSLPYVGITIYPEQEREGVGTHGREDIGYGCGVAIILATDHASTRAIGRATTMRALIRREFVHQKMEKVRLGDGCYLTTKVSHLPINIPHEAHRYEASSLLIRCWMREPRG